MAKLTGAKKEAFLKRMAAGRRKATKKKRTPKKKPNTSVRKAKKVIAKGFTKPLAAAWSKTKKAARKAAHKAKAPAKKNSGRRRVGGSIKCAKCGKSYKTQGGYDNHKCKTAAKNPAAKKRKSAANHKHRRNSSMAEAEAMFETFHQKPPGHIVDYEMMVRFPDKFAELGRLRELRIYLDDDNTDFPFTRFGDCTVACTPDGRNIYFIGGDQSIDLAALGIASDKDMVELGPCTYIEYQTVKGFHDFEPIRYWHEFGEEDEIHPVLCYDRLNKTLFLVSGNYTVKYEGITN